MMAYSIDNQYIILIIHIIIQKPIENPPLQKMLLFHSTQFCAPKPQNPSSLYQTASSSSSPILSQSFSTSTSPNHPTNTASKVPLMIKRESFTKIFMKIFLYFGIKIGVILLNLFFVNVHVPYLEMSFGIGGVIIVGEIVTFVLSKLWGQELDPAHSIENDQQSEQSPQQYLNIRQQQKDQSMMSYSNKQPKTQKMPLSQNQNPNQLHAHPHPHPHNHNHNHPHSKGHPQKKKKSDKNKIRILVNLFWHFIFAANVCFFVFGFVLSIQPVLSTNVFKLRSALYAIQFFAILSAVFMVFSPTPSHLLFLKYKQSQENFLKYLFLVYTIGSFFDYVSFGVSNLGIYNVPDVDDFQKSEQFLNFANFYICAGFLLIGGFISFSKKVQILERVKEIIDLE